MNRLNNQLSGLIDVLRKDAGINNAIDALEQLSLLLLFRYFHEVVLDNVTAKMPISVFSGILSGDHDDHANSFFTRSSLLKDLYNETCRDLKNNEPLKDNYSFDVCGRIEILLDSIPLKIRSPKIMEYFLSQLNEVHFDKGLAVAYDDLLVDMKNDSASSGAYHSPKPLVSAIVEVIRPTAQQSIYDPAMGTGRFFVEAQKRAPKHSHGALNSPVHAFGKDISPFACLVGTLNLLLNGIGIKNVSLGDSLLCSDGPDCDIVLSGIPFGRVQGIDTYEYAYRGYASSLEMMFIKHAMRKLADDGKAALIVPDGVMHKRNQESVNLRRELLVDLNLHSILSLPAKALAPYVGVKASVLFFDKTRPGKDIWVYELKTDKPLSNIHQIAEHDFVEFIELFSIRSETDNSYLVDKRDILESKGLDLPTERPRQIDVVEMHDVSKGITLLKQEKHEYDLLLSQFTELLNENRQAEFINKVSIGDLFTMKAGKPLSKAEIEEHGEYPVYGGNGIIGYYSESNLDGENILIGRVGAKCGNVHFVKNPIWLTGNSFSLRLNTYPKVHLQYLTHVLRSLNLNMHARGSAQPSISYSKIKEIEISLPEYEKQVELAEWFEKIQLQNTKLSEILRLQINTFNELANCSITSNSVEG